MVTIIPRLCKKPKEVGRPAAEEGGHTWSGHSRSPGALSEKGVALNPSQPIGFSSCSLLNDGILCL